MISTRMHSLIDYTVAGLFGGLAGTSQLAPPVRRVLGAAGAYHASYSLLTDYEGGVEGWLTMRQHLALDAIGGAALFGAGMLMHRQPTGARGFLMAAGLSELAVAAFSSTTPASRPSGGLVRRLSGSTGSQVELGYPPLGTPKPLAPDVFIVDSLMPGAIGKLTPARMTVIRLPGGDLLLHSPTPYSGELQRQLEQLGRIRHLMAPNVVHWMFVKDWQQACPAATVWAAPGLGKRRQVRRSGLRIDHELSEATPSAWGEEHRAPLGAGRPRFHRGRAASPADPHPCPHGSRAQSRTAQAGGVRASGGRPVRHYGSGRNAASIPSGDRQASAARGGRRRAPTARVAAGAGDLRAWPYLFARRDDGTAAVAPLASARLTSPIRYPCARQVG